MIDRFFNAQNVVTDFHEKSSRYLCFLRVGNYIPDYAFLGKEYGFDVFISAYMEPINYNKFINFASGVSTGGLSKFHAFKELSSQLPSLLYYDYYAFIDADIVTTAETISALFEQGELLGLDCYQPAVSKDSYSAFHFLFEGYGTGFLRTNFVEVMCPFMSKKMLIDVVDLFDKSISTWGLDYLWPNISTDAKIGVFYNFIVIHPDFPDSKNGPFYKYLHSLNVDPYVELATILKSYIRIGYYPHAGHDWTFSYIGMWLWRPIEWLSRRRAKRAIKKKIRGFNEC